MKNIICLIIATSVCFAEDKPSIKKVEKWVKVNGVELPQFDGLEFEGNAADKIIIGKALAQFYEGWTLDKLKKVFGKPTNFKSFSETRYIWYEAPSDHEILYNKVTEKSSGFVTWQLDKKTLKVVYVQGWWELDADKTTPHTPTKFGASLGFTIDNWNTNK